MRRAALVAVAALALAVCGGCRDQANPAPGSTGSSDGTSQFDQVETTLASIEADVNQP